MKKKYLPLIVLVVIVLLASFHRAAKLITTESTKPSIYNSQSSTDHIFDNFRGHKKVVYLTFDDGPDRRWTPRILSILKKNRIKATFFVVGTSVQEYPDIFRREVREGHCIGNHTYDHNYREIYSSPACYIESIRKNDQLLRSYGVITHITRPPGGHHLPTEAAQWLKAHRMRSIMWNLSCGDGFTTTKDVHFLITTVNNRLYNMKNKDQVIVLMHDGIKGVDPASWEYSQMAKTREADIQALPEIINQFKRKGYTFAVFKEI